MADGFRLGVLVVVSCTIVAALAAGSVASVGDTPTEPAATDGEPTVAWNETYGGDGDDLLKTGVRTDDGYLLVGQTETDEGDVDGWVLGVDESGEQLFETILGGPGEDRFSDAIRTDDGYLLAGWRSDENGTAQGWLVHLDEEGEVEWNRTLGTDEWDGFWKLEATPDGNYVAVGRTHFEGWAVMVDDGGELQWNQTYEFGGNQTNLAAVTTLEDGYLLAGWAESNGTESALAIAVDDSGEERWNLTVDADVDRRIWAAVRTDDGIALVGEEIDESEPTALAILVDEEEVASTWTAVEPGNRYVDAIEIDGGFLAVGSGDTAENGSDAIATRFDALEPQWTVTHGGTNWDLALSAVETDDGSLLVGSTTSYDADGEDGWIVNLTAGNETDE